MDQVAPTETTSTIARFVITGMTCAACVSRLERLLMRQPGVLSASISLTAERAELVFDSERIGVPDLITAVEAAGFGARPVAKTQTSEVQTSHEESRTAEDGPVRPVLVISGLLCLPLLAEMIGMLAGVPVGLPGWLQWGLATPIQFWAGARFYRGAWFALRTGGANMDVLVAVGTSAAYGLGVWRVLDGAPPQFEAAALVILLVIVGKGLEARARRATNRAVELLLASRPETARRRGRDGREETIPVGLIMPGDLAVVRAGERIPVDGVVVEGRASVNEAMVSGEPMPMERGPGAFVIGGTHNLDGCLTLRVRAVGDDAILGQMIALVGHAQATKPRIQRLADQVSGWFAFLVVGIAVVTAVGWWLATGEPLAAILPAVTVLVVACPCALGLATPAVMAVAFGVAARHGLLIRDAEALETACRVTTVLFDKTGTLTEGRPEWADIEVVEGDSDGVLALAAGVQRGNDHPLARAMTEAARVRALDVPEPVGFRALPGRGVAATVAGRDVVVGSLALITEIGINPAPLTRTALAWEQAGRTVVWVGETGPQHPPRLLGVIAVTDRLRSGAGAALAALVEAGIDVVMLTGDGLAAAMATGTRLGLAPSQIRAGVRPEGKIAEVERRQAAGHRVAMVGDGINDAPALARADLGIAMAGGTDVAVHAAGVTLMRGDPLLVPVLIDLAWAVRRKMIQNMVWAFGFNLVALPLAALGVFGPVMAAVAMASSSLIVVGNALSLQRWRPARGSAVTSAQQPDGVALS
jgi:Cu+-exporting ATPase